MLGAKLFLLVISCQTTQKVNKVPIVIIIGSTVPFSIMADLSMDKKSTFTEFVTPLCWLIFPKEN